MDTVTHSWQILSSIILTGLTENILCDFGIPVEHNGVFYNCRILVFNSKIILIRPKMAMADDGNYREVHWFSAWKKGFFLEDFIHPANIADALKQERTKI